MTDEDIRLRCIELAIAAVGTAGKGEIATIARMYYHWVTNTVDPTGGSASNG